MAMWAAESTHFPKKSSRCPGSLGLPARHWVASGMRFELSVLENESHGKKRRGFAGAGEEKKIQYRISLLIQAK